MCSNRRSIKNIKLHLFVEVFIKRSDVIMEKLLFINIRKKNLTKKII